MKKVYVVASLLVSLLTASMSQAEEMAVRYFQGLLGSLDADEAWVIEDDITGEQAKADISKMIYGGGLVQLSHLDGRFQYGLETGALLSFRNDTSTFVEVDNGATVAIKVENNMWLIDVSVGGFVSYRPWDFMRMYVSAGPSIIYGSLSIDDDDVTPSPHDSGTIVYSPSSRESDFDFGFYGRTGIDFILPNKITVGISARRLSSELNFGNSGIIDLENTQYFIAIGKAY